MSAVAGLVLVAAILFFRSDLRGWTPADPGDPAALVQPVDAAGAAFTIGDCVPGTVDPWGTPTSAEYSGSATVTVLTCRSRSSALVIGLASIAAAFIALIILHRRSERGRREI
jgi:hypothetical protein